MGLGMSRSKRPNANDGENSNEFLTGGRREHDAQEQFRRLFERYYHTVFRFFSTRGFSEEESSDLTQETFLRVYKGMASFRGDSGFEVWLFQIAYNIWKNEVRSRSALKREAWEVPFDETLASPEVPTVRTSPRSERDPLSSLLQDEIAQSLRQAFENLPPQMRRCVLLRVDQDLKYREIAALMGISIQTVKAQLHQALKRLQAELGDSFVGFNL
jgi:RNA polymerase sigma-70 factor (ECF subfamily)